MTPEARNILTAISAATIGGVIGLFIGWASMSSGITHDCRQWGGFEYLTKTFNCTERKAAPPKPEVTNGN